VRARAVAVKKQERSDCSILRIDLERIRWRPARVLPLSRNRHERLVMKIVVIGRTGLIGSKVVEKLKQKGHEAIAAAPNTGVNTITGKGLKEALADAQVVVDLANSPSFEDKRYWNSSRPPSTTFSRLRPQPAFGTMSRYRSSESTEAKMAISAPRSPKRN
jgi:hypothetical protein